MSNSDHTVGNSEVGTKKESVGISSYRARITERGEYFGFMVKIIKVKPNPETFQGGIWYSYQGKGFKKCGCYIEKRFSSARILRFLCMGNGEQW